MGNTHYILERADESVRENTTTDRKLTESEFPVN